MQLITSKFIPRATSPQTRQINGNLQVRFVKTIGFSGSESETNKNFIVFRSKFYRFFQIKTRIGISTLTDLNCSQKSESKENLESIRNKFSSLRHEQVEEMSKEKLKYLSLTKTVGSFSSLFLIFEPSQREK